MSESCIIARDGDALHGYVAGTLSPEETEDFEVHLLGCRECQADVREGAALSVALGSEKGSAFRRPLLPVALIAGAAALVAAVVLWPSGRLERLGTVMEAPAFVGIAVRADGDSATLLADRAMRVYQAGDWSRAAELLDRALRSDPEPALHFFRGVSLLMADDPEAARLPLAAALVPPDGPYAPEAHFYLAKALLRLGRGQEALAHLDAAAADRGTAPGGVADHAAALADSVRRVLGR